MLMAKALSQTGSSLLVQDIVASTSGQSYQAINVASVANTVSLISKCVSPRPISVSKCVTGTFIIVEMF